jgi:hypothetical protein
MNVHRHAQGESSRALNEWMVSALYRAKRDEPISFRKWSAHLLSVDNGAFGCPALRRLTFGPDRGRGEDGNSWGTA